MNGGRGILLSITPRRGDTRFGSLRTSDNWKLSLIAHDTAYFALAFLLLLSIVTMTQCKRNGPTAKSYPEFLFRGRTFAVSLASSAGAAFSVTYFLGATFIYASILRAWTIPILVAVAISAVLFLRRIITCASNEQVAAEAADAYENLLLRLMRNRLDKRNFKIFCDLLFGCFLLLLVEELSISRVVLDSLMPGMPFVTAVLLFIIVGVILAYLYIGGFRAVLTADWIQLFVMLAFLALLLYFVATRRRVLSSLMMSPKLPSFTIVGATLLWTIYATTFLVMAVDLFSRMNFASPGELAVTMRLRFATISIVLVFLIVILGIGFAIAVSPEIGAIATPEQYYLTLHRIFAAVPLYHVAFLIAVFCMIFTTVNTLIVTVAQIGYYRGGFGAQRRDFSRVLALAVLPSVIMPSDAVCAFGIFVGSLLFLPCVQVLREVFRRRAAPCDDRFLWLALLLSVGGFVFLYPLVETDFEHQFLIPGMVVSVTVMSFAAVHLPQIFRRGSRS